MSTSNRISAVEFPTPTRLHIAVAVRDVAAALPFYRTLFGQEPTKVRADYAKFEVLDPPVTCCYAVQDKFWATDPDGHRWEVFVVTQAEAAVHSENRTVTAPACCPQPDNSTAPAPCCPR